MFFLQFLLDDRGVGSRAGTIYLTNGFGCGSGMPKNIWILRIGLRIRIRNTALLTRTLPEWIVPVHSGGNPF
jgi:hypothetical protein